MTAFDFELTEQAGSDVEDILEYTASAFGLRQVGIYEDLINRAITLVAENPDRPGSKFREDIGVGVRAFHIELAGKRAGTGSHILYYTLGLSDDSKTVVIIARILHDSMEPAARVIEALSDR
jgi:toxin ParE1/3/4